MEIEALTLIEVIGIVSYAISGCLVAMKKHMDFFGFCFLGVITSVGGGAIRDILIGRTPPVLFTNPVFVIVSFSVSVLTFLIIYFRIGRSKIKKNIKVFETINFWIDTIGLAAFTADGITVGFNCVENPSAFLIVSLGVCTGIGGGIIRDLLAQEMSAVFVKHVYAVAAIAGAIVIVNLWNVIGQNWATVAGSVVIITIRFLAAKFHWNMPKIRQD